MEMTPTDRAALAEKVQVGDAYLYQCLTGRKDMKPEEAVRVERDSGRAVRRWHLRSNDWWKVWPELIGADGAPKVPADVHDSAASEAASEATS